MPLEGDKANSGAGSKPSILVFVSYYRPGFKGGGPITTIENLVQCFGNRFDFRIVTRDRDQGDDKPYADSGRWKRVGEADVYYCPRSEQGFRGIRKLIADTPHDGIYLNSAFDRAFTIIPLILRRIGWLQDKPLVVAPRGEFADGALGINPRRKMAFLKLARMVGLYRDVVWQASSEFERADIERRQGQHALTVLAMDILQATESSEIKDVPQKRTGEIRLVFLGRISRVKNLEMALRVISKAKASKITFDLFGPIEDQSSWENCKKIAASLPVSTTVQYRGQVLPQDVNETLARYDLFFMPSKSENFGHAIVEAMAARCPVLISDRTPWRELEHVKAGWDISLASEYRFVEVVNQVARMPFDEHEKWRHGAVQFSNRVRHDVDILAANKSLLALLTRQASNSAGQI